MLSCKTHYFRPLRCVASAGPRLFFDGCVSAFQTFQFRAQSGKHLRFPLGAPARHIQLELHCFHRRKVTLRPCFIITAVKAVKSRSPHPRQIKSPCFRHIHQNAISFMGRFGVLQRFGTRNQWTGVRETQGRPVRRYFFHCRGYSARICLSQKFNFFRPSTGAFPHGFFKNSTSGVKSHCITFRSWPHLRDGAPKSHMKAQAAGPNASGSAP